MGTVRDFVCEKNIPYDVIVEAYGKFYIECTTNGLPIISHTSFIKFFNVFREDIDEHAYKGVVLEYEKET
jgi:hypothetical protein